MTIRRRPARSVAAVVGPIPLLLVPKCPLCILPLLAAMGLAAPPTIVFTAIVAVAVVGWEVLLFRVTRSWLLRASGVVPAALLIAGRIWSVAPATYLATTFMVTVGFLAARRCRAACSANETEKGARCPLQANDRNPSFDASPTTSPSPFQR